MTSIHVGDIVAFYWERKLKIGLVLSWTGDPDQLARLAVDGEQKIYAAYTDRMAKAGEAPRRGDMLITAEQGRKARQRIESFLATKAGRRMLARMEPAERADPYWTGVGDVPVRGPSAGGGAPSATEPPLVLSQGRTSHLSRSMTNVLCGTPYRYAMCRLKEEHPTYWRVWHLHEDLGEPMERIARDEGASQVNVRQRKFQARIKLRSYIKEWFKLDREERVA